MRILLKALLKTTFSEFSWNSPCVKMKQTSANSIPFGFFAEKEVNELMEELFETVSNDLRMRTQNSKSGFSSKLCPLVPGPLSPEGWCERSPFPFQSTQERI